MVIKELVVWQIKVINLKKKKKKTLLPLFYGWG